MISAQHGSLDVREYNSSIHAVHRVEPARYILPRPAGYKLVAQHFCSGYQVEIILWSYPRPDAEKKLHHKRRNDYTADFFIITWT
jgi:hypothetical protein